MNLSENIFIAGHTGLVGQAFVRKFQSDGDSTLLLRTRVELDLMSQGEVYESFLAEKPDGMPLKNVNRSKMNSVGLKSSTPFRTGLKKGYQWFLSNNIYQNNHIIQKGQ